MYRSHNSPFITHHDAFKDVLGDAPRLIKVIDADAHEGPVYMPDEDALYFTTLPMPLDDPRPGFQNVAIKRLALNGGCFPVGVGESLGRAQRGQHVQAALRATGAVSPMATSKSQQLFLTSLDDRR
jgi:hypothetical protein